MRTLIAVAMSVSIGIGHALADDAKETAEQLVALKAKFAAEMADIQAKLDLSTVTDRKAVEFEIRELSIITAQSALELAQADPKTGPGLDAALFAAEKAGKYGPGKEVEAALEIVAAHHLSNPKVQAAIPIVAKAGLAGQKFLGSVVEKTTDKDVRAIALFFLGVAEAKKMEATEDAKELDESTAKATTLFERAAKESPSAKIGSSTVTKRAAEQMESLKAFQALAVGKPIPDVGAFRLDSKPVKLSDYKGRVVLFDVWATWCPPCRAMIPHEREMVANLKDKPFTLVSLSVDDEKEILEKFLADEPMPWDHWWDAGKESSAVGKLRINAFPTLYLIDHTGVLRHKWVGKPGNEALDNAVETLVEEAVKAKR